MTEVMYAGTSAVVAATPTVFGLSATPTAAELQATTIAVMGAPVAAGGIGLDMTWANAKVAPLGLPTSNPADFDMFFGAMWQKYPQVQEINPADVLWVYGDGTLADQQG